MNQLRELIKKLAHSLSARLLLIFFIASMAYGYSARYAFTLFQDTDYLRRIAGAHVALHIEYVLNDIGSPPNLARAQEIVDTIPVDMRIVGPGVDWRSTQDFYPIEEIPFGPPTWLELSDTSLSQVEEWVERLDQVEFARYQEHTIIKLKDDDFDIIFVSPRISEMPGPDIAGYIIGLIGIMVLFFVYLAVRWVFRPISWMQEGAARIGRGELDYRIPTRRHDELGDLSHDINEMAKDVQDMLEAKRQLMLAISHELRSPLTRSKVALELIEDENARANILEDIEEMERLISDLLESEALNTRHAKLRLEPVNIEELVETLLEVDFHDRRKGIKADVQRGLPLFELDATRIRLLLRNILDNGLRYNGEAGRPLELTVSAKDNELLLEVQDFGPGIAEEHLRNVTQAFYRADPARSRATGGVGLGLYLCRRIAEAHGGCLEITSHPGAGTRVSVKLPV